ncbi:MAG: peptidase [Rhodovulum sulfidophilum]|uniref:Peptidase n=1 Tax=Rhodovulum sulfidophilum TaxID=35806 RepID=A0A2W5NLP7_RHOSU|nr:MAG: peptidase [Rhodovulum sulfidophilum]
MAEVGQAEPRARGARIVACARAWIGTPYRHQASCKGAGTDCLGLLRGIWRELLGAEPEAVPPYTSDWAEVGRGEDLLEAARRHLDAIARAEAVPGDVLVLRMADGATAKHVGILARAPEGHETIVHAYSGHGVVESPLTPAWSRRVAGAFRFPDRRN